VHTTRQSRDHRSDHESWDVAHLEELAENGSLAAARELMDRIVRQCERTSTARPDLLQPTLARWLKSFFDRVADDPRQPAGDLMAGSRPKHGSGKRLTPLSHAELVQAVSLAEEAHIRVQLRVDDGMSLMSAVHAVTSELNALGYGNRRNEPLSWFLVRDRYYKVRRMKQRARRT